MLCILSYFIKLPPIFILTLLMTICGNNRLLQTVHIKTYTAVLPLNNLRERMPYCLCLFFSIIYVKGQDGLCEMVRRNKGSTALCAESTSSLFVYELSWDCDEVWTLGVTYCAEGKLVIQMQ